MIGIPLQTTDTVLLPLPPEAIWPVLADISQYPQWWPTTLFAKVSPAPTGLIGSELHLRPMGIRRFTCRVVAAEAPHAIDLEYVGHFITGHAQWLLEPEGQGTRVHYGIDVIVHDRMAALGAKLIDLTAVHSHSMQGIFQGLRHRLFSSRR